MNKSITHEEGANLVLMLAILLGSVVCFLPTCLAGFPIGRSAHLAAAVPPARLASIAITSWNPRLYRISTISTFRAFYAPKVLGLSPTRTYSYAIEQFRAN